MGKAPCKLDQVGINRLTPSLNNFKSSCLLVEMGLHWLEVRIFTWGWACAGFTCLHYKWIEILTHRKNWLKHQGFKRSPSALEGGVLSQRKKAISVFHGAWINQMMHFHVHAGLDLSGNINGVAKNPLLGSDSLGVCYPLGCCLEKVAPSLGCLIRFI